MDKKLFTHDLIRSLGFTAAGLAIKVGMAPTAMGAYLHGRVTPSLTTARQICALLNIPLDVVVFPAEKKEEHA